MIKHRPSSPVATPAAAPEGSLGGDGMEKGAQICEQIGRELRALFDNVVSDPVPERFRSLLDALERNEQGQGDKS